MVTPAPLCRQCGGKFGRLSLPPYCELCGQLAQLTTHLYSQRFPQALSGVAEGAIREALHRCLAASDCYWGAEEARRCAEKAPEKSGQGSDTGAKESALKTEEGEAVQSPPVKVETSRSAPSLPGLSGKAASPCRPVSPVVERTSNPCSEESTPGRSSKAPIEESRKRSKHKKRRKKSRSRSHRSRSRRKRKEDSRREIKESPGSEETPGRRVPSREPVRPSSVRHLQEEVRRERSPSRSLAARDYSGYYQQPAWVGPIPSAGSRQQERQPGRSPRRAANKGLKKRQQQERARAYGGWNNRGGKGGSRR